MSSAQRAQRAVHVVDAERADAPQDGRHARGKQAPARRKATNDARREVAQRSKERYPTSR